MTKRFLAPLSTDHVDFNLSNPSQDAEGRLRWNADEGTLNLGMGGDVVQQIGEEFFVSKVLNKSGVEIPNGTFVMATGAQGDQITIAKAVTNGTVDPKYMLGFATRTIPVGSNTGRVTMYGVVRDMNTSAWPVGTVLYPNPAVAGGLTSTEPVAPNVRTPVAIVIRQHASTGRIYVRMTNGSTLGGTDSNVKFENLQAGDTITYNAESGIWVNAQPTGGGGVIVSDTPPLSPSSGQLWFNSTNAKTYVRYDSTWVEVGAQPVQAAVQTDVYLSNSWWLGV